ncbi:hypothetical protein [Sandarakinorhabdus sp.]|uniref:hypothetical protein n=1 Tax=Sandarakinorhabdus sp. TaxID=1916663 RepID=UPI00286E0437|nr:hypothetical protein [Sandarakinorhabdus sp.]
MSGDFLSKTESRVCLARGIDDRVAVVRDLNALVDRNGLAGAEAVLGFAGATIGPIVERRIGITERILEALYGPRGRKLRADLGAASDPMSRIMAAVRPVEALAVVPMVPVAAAPSVPDSWAAAGTSAAEIAAILADARNLGMTWAQIAAACGAHDKTLGNLFVGRFRPGVDLLHKVLTLRPVIAQHRAVQAQRSDEIEAPPIEVAANAAAPAPVAEQQVSDAVTEDAAPERGAAACPAADADGVQPDVLPPPDVLPVMFTAQSEASGDVIADAAAALAARMTFLDDVQAEAWQRASRLQGELDAARAALDAAADEQVRVGAALKALNGLTALAA